MSAIELIIMWKLIVDVVYLNDVFHEGFVGGHFGLLHDRHGGSNPGDKDELGSLAHFVTGLQE